jgi:uncharacterized protein
MKKILSIDSGGIRGIIPAIILAGIEQRAGQPICDLFDFFAGTSAGGMLVLGLNCPEPYRSKHPSFCASEIVGFFYEWGCRVFKKKSADKSQGRTQGKSAEPIEEMLREYFGDNRLSDCIKPTLVTAFDLNAREPFFFNSARTNACIVGDPFMWQTAKATTAIPTHFKPLRLTASFSTGSGPRMLSLVDGSLFASNPAAYALAEARAKFPEENDFLLVSLGCGEAACEQTARDTRTRSQILASSLATQSNCADHQLQHLLPKQRYLRIQTKLRPGLDRIDTASENDLFRMEEAARRTLEDNARVLERLVDLLSPRFELAA